MSDYTARARPMGKYWHVEVVGVGVTQAPHVREIETMAADLIKVMVEDSEPSVTVELDLRTEVVAQERADELRAVEAKARAEVRAAARARRI